jgi:hypothetical protein
VNDESAGSFVFAAHRSGSIFFRRAYHALMPPNRAFPRPRHITIAAKHQRGANFIAYGKNLQSGGRKDRAAFFLYFCRFFQNNLAMVKFM